MTDDSSTETTELRHEVVFYVTDNGSALTGYDLMTTPLGTSDTTWEWHPQPAPLPLDDTALQGQLDNFLDLIGRERRGSWQRVSIGGHPAYAALIDAPPAAR